MKKTKVTVLLLLVFCINLGMYYDVNALSKQVYITVKVNSCCIKMDTLPYIKDNRTFVSLSFIVQALGAKVKWIEEQEEAVVTSGTKTIEMFVGCNKFMVNGEERLMDTVVEKKNNRTMVPLKFISENLDCSVRWDPLTYSVLIDKKDIKVPETTVLKRSYTDDDLLWLARIVSVEARGLSINAKVAVANVILNRKKNPQFPDTIYKVIFDKSYHVQFPPAHKSGFKKLKPEDECIVAAKMALEGVNNIGGCLYFNDVLLKGKAASSYKRIEGMYFYK